MGYPVKPSGYVGWGSTGMTNTVEPTDAKKAVGWATNEQPPSSYFNWLQAKQDEWIQYLDWRSKLRTVTDEGFCFSDDTADALNQKSTGLAPLWSTSGTLVYAFAGQLLVGDNSAAFGVATGYFRRGEFPGSYAAPLKDFIFQTEIEQSAGSASSYMNVGFVNMLDLIATGASGWWNLRYFPSGCLATALGMSMYGASSMAVEVISRGATMTVSRNGQMVYAVPAVMMGTATGLGITGSANVPAAGYFGAHWIQRGAGSYFVLNYLRHLESL